MKKLCLVVLLIFSLVTLSFSMEKASASGTYTVNFTGNFSTDNLGIDFTGDYAYGSTISFDSSIGGLSGYTFAFWIVNGHVRYDLPVDHQFIINGTMNIEAVFSNDSTYAVVFMDTNGNSLDIQYVASGQDATPPLEGELPDKPGFVVNSTTPWSESYQNITNHTVTILQYTISSATTYTISVTNGTGAGDYTFNDTVTVVADTPTGDDYFLYWQENGVIVSYNETYKFAALRNRSLTAVYGASPVTENPLVTLSSDLEIRTNYASYLGQFSLPNDHTLIEYGILRSNTNATPVHDSVDATRYRSEKYYGATDEFLMSFSDDKVYQRAYLVSEDTLGTLHYTYSNVIETSIGSETLVLSMDFSSIDLTCTMMGTSPDEHPMCFYHDTYTVSTLRGDGTSNLNMVIWEHQTDGGYVFAENPGLLGISSSNISKPNVTVVIELSVLGSSDGAMMIVYGTNSEGTYFSEYNYYSLVPTGGTAEVVFQISSALNMDALQVVIALSNPGSTISIYSVTILEDN